MINRYLQTFILVAYTFFCNAQGQEIQIFTLADFDLKENVKFCLVSTDYGKEEYDFNKKGFLTKAVTRYNDTDYDVVYYKYKFLSKENGSGKHYSSRCINIKIPPKRGFGKNAKRGIIRPVYRTN